MKSDVFSDMITTKSLFITPEMLTLTAQIDEFKGAWQALGSIAPERLSALRRVATIESVGSSTRIEGSALSDSDVEKLLANLAIGSLSHGTSRKLPGTRKQWNGFSNPSIISA